jgi:hypothetical protein
MPSVALWLAAEKPTSLATAVASIREQFPLSPADSALPLLEAPGELLSVQGCTLSRIPAIFFPLPGPLRRRGLNRLAHPLLAYGDCYRGQDLLSWVIQTGLADLSPVLDTRP